MTRRHAVREGDAARWAEVVDSEGLAELLGVARATTHTWVARGLLPEPAYRLRGVPWWYRSVIETWAAETGRLSRPTP